MAELALKDVKMHYCPGCGHISAHRLLCGALDELGLRERTIGVAPVGCAVLAYDYWNFDVTEAAHGRAPAVATGIKRALPDRIVFTYQGDGDLAAIGTGEIIHAANRGENITVIFINNGVYGMTGGQLAPTSMIGQRTATSLKGRAVARDGYPLKITEMLALLAGVKYVERVAIHTAEKMAAAKTAIKKAFQAQVDNKGFTFVEIVTVCPTHGTPSLKDAFKRIDEQVAVYYPLGVIKDEIS